MAIKTQLGPTAIPGQPYSFSAKTATAAVEWQDATFVGIDNITDKFVVLVGKIIIK